MFWRWWSIFSLIALFFSVVFVYDGFQYIWDNDVTKLSFVIIAEFICTSLFIGWTSLKVAQTKDNTDPKMLEYKKHSETSWFLSETMVTIGMIGTIIGFLLMLSGAFAELDVHDINSVKEVLTMMAIGMSTAFITTLVGLVGSLFTKAQLINLDHEITVH